MAARIIGTHSANLVGCVNRTGCTVLPFHRRRYSTAHLLQFAGRFLDNLPPFAEVAFRRQNVSEADSHHGLAS